MSDKYVRIVAWIPENLDTALKVAARVQDRPYASIIREALSKHLGVPIEPVAYGGYRPRKPKSDKKKKSGEETVA